jgi:hypothetical protein
MDGVSENYGHIASNAILNDFEKSVLADLPDFILLGFFNVLLKIFFETLAFDRVDLSFQIRNDTFEDFNLFGFLEGKLSFVEKVFEYCFVLEDRSINGLNSFVKSLKKKLSFFIGFFEIIFLD